MALDNLHATEMRKANDEAMEKMDGQEKCLDDRQESEGRSVDIIYLKIYLNYLSILGMIVRSCNLKFSYVCLGIDVNNAS